MTETNAHQEGVNPEDTANQRTLAEPVRTKRKYTKRAKPKAGAMSVAAVGSAKKSDASEKRVVEGVPIAPWDAASEKPVSEELMYRTKNAYMCLVVRRRTGLLRVIDFRMGGLPEKRSHVDSVAREENAIKMMVIVEKDEIPAWTQLGFVREGVVPGFYKRTDGHVCGCVVGKQGPSTVMPEQSVRCAEQTIETAREAAAKLQKPVRKAKVARADKDKATQARDKAWAAGEATGAFDAFGRDSVRLHYQTAYKKMAPMWLYAEYEECFGHAFVESLRAPSRQSQRVALVAGLRTMEQDLLERGLVSAFSFAPVDDLEMATVFIAAGYRKTGLLTQGAVAGGVRKDAILWSRRFVHLSDSEKTLLDI